MEVSTPQDWDYDLLDANCKRGSGHTPNKKIQDYYDGDIVWVSLADSDKLDKGIIASSAIRISEKGIANSSATLHQKGVVLMSRDAGVGKSAIAGCDLCVSQHFITWFCNEKTLHNWYLYFWLQYQKKEFERIAMGSTIKTIGLPFFKQYKLPLPQYKEQTAIATTLSEADALISSLENLIAKKRNIKQGVMQDLLKPKKGWEAKSLFELADNRKELFGDGDWIEAEHIVDKGIRLVQTGNIGIGIFLNKGIRRYISQDSFSLLRCKELLTGDILICRLADPAGRACILPDIQETKMITSVDVTIFRPRKELVNRTFLINLLSTASWFKAVAEKSGGTTHKRISRRTLGEMRISIPSKAEQDNTAAILSTMDAEITSLQSKLNKYRQIKSGMMQNLLTGKIRLL